MSQKRKWRNFNGFLANRGTLYGWLVTTAPPSYLDGCRPIFFQDRIYIEVQAADRALELLPPPPQISFASIDPAYERTSVIVTTNLPFEQWTEVLGSERLTGAVLDRLTHRCHILEASGESYRLKDARRRSSGKKTAEIPAKPPEKDQSAPTN